MNDRLPIDGPSMQTLRRERDRLRAEVQQLRDRMRRFDPGAFVLASDVAEALGDMLEEP